jgi:hypothetical protein
MKWWFLQKGVNNRVNPIKIQIQFQVKFIGLLLPHPQRERDTCWQAGGPDRRQGRQEYHQDFWIFKKFINFDLKSIYEFIKIHSI